MGSGARSSRRGKSFPRELYLKLPRFSRTTLLGHLFGESTLRLLRLEWNEFSLLSGWLALLRSVLSRRGPLAGRLTASCLTSAEVDELESLLAGEDKLGKLVGEERIRLLPLSTFSLVRANDARGVKDTAIAAIVGPDRGFGPADADGVDWLLAHA